MPLAVVEVWDKSVMLQSPITYLKTELTMTKSNDKIDKVFTNSNLKKTVIATKDSFIIRYETRKPRRKK